MIHVLAAIVGGGIALAIGPSSLVTAMPASCNPWLGAALLGLMASGGSAFWNHALDIVGAVKTVREGAAAATRDGTPNGKAAAVASQGGGITASRT